MAQRVRFHLKARQIPTPQGTNRLRVTISGSMSANAIMRHYPKSQELFEQLQIDRRFEGYESVDELAWRKGMDVSEVIHRLQQAIGFL